MFPKKQRSQNPKHNSRKRSTASQYQTTVSETITQVNYQPSGDPRALPKLKLMEFSGDPLVSHEWAELFDAIVLQNWLSDTKKLQYL